MSATADLPGSLAAEAQTDLTVEPAPLSVVQATRSADPTVTIGRATLACLTLPQAVERVLDLRSEPRPTLVVTANSDHVVRLETDGALAAAYAEADLAVIDGTPLVWASRLMPTSAPERVSGVDLFTALCESPKTGMRLFLLGGSEANSAAAERVLADRYPHLTIVGRNTAWLTDQSSPGVIDEIAAARPDVVAIFLGCPKQEVWVQRYRDLLPPAAYLCLGGTVDIVSGALPRAGRLWQRLGLEWLHRLLLEPRRLWRRYLVDDPRFVLIAGRSVRAARRRDRRVPSED
jgi:N-acetylglucosaminyldiphosphoundecaprenol N-acetyl-beta-D-mannosaminyltransferase